MKSINTKYIQYDWLFIKYPGLKQAFDWYQNNNYKYQFLNKLILFKKYYYSANKFDYCDLYFIGAYPDEDEKRFINLYCIEKKYTATPRIFQIEIDMNNNLSKNNQLIDFLYDSYKPDEYLNKEDI